MSLRSLLVSDFVLRENIALLLLNKMCFESWFCLMLVSIQDIQRAAQNRNLGISRVPLKIQVHQGTSLFTSTAKNQRGC